MVSDVTNCRNCSDAVKGNFCSNCGQPVKVKRVDFHYLSHEIQHLMHVEKGFLYTVKEMFLRPGQTVREFIADNRSRLVKPIIYLIVASLIYSTIDHFFHVEEEHFKATEIKGTAINLIFTWVQSHYGYANIIMGVFIALWVKLFFKSSPYNFFEILILLCFAIGTAMLLAVVFTVAEGLSKINLVNAAGIAGVIYSSWAIGQFFGQKKPASYIKALIAYLLGMLTFTVIALVIGIVIDVSFKH